MIWATDIRGAGASSSGGGKGSSGSARPPSSISTTPTSPSRCAKARSRGLGRVWADGKELDLSDYDWRLHTGSENQEPDSLIVAREGADNAPAYRGTAYIVFERMPLETFGNRLPQLSFEVYRAVDPFEAQVRAVVLIPGSGEFVYATDPVTRSVGLAQTETENTHTPPRRQRLGGRDRSASETRCPTPAPSRSS